MVYTPFPAYKIESPIIGTFITILVNVRMLEIRREVNFRAENEDVRRCMGIAVPVCECHKLRYSPITYVPPV